MPSMDRVKSARQSGGGAARLGGPAYSDAAVQAGAVAPPGGWLLFALLLVSGLAAIISLSRAGIRHFWSPGGQFAVRLQSAEAAAVVTLLLSCVLLAARAERAGNGAARRGRGAKKAANPAAKSARSAKATKPKAEKEQAPARAAPARRKAAGG